MTKYRTRYEYTIARSSDSQRTEDNWIDAIEGQLKKQAVQPRRVDESLYDQINNIMGNKSKHRSVTDAVEEMQRRSGYLDYLGKRAQNLVQGKNTSSSDEPQLFKEHPEIKNTIINNIESTKGNLEIQSIIDNAMRIHKKDVVTQNQWEDPKLIKFIFDYTEKERQSKNKEDVSSNLGKVEFTMEKQDVDPANDDAWKGLMLPTK